MTLGEFRALTKDVDDVELAVGTDEEVNRICPVSKEPWLERFPDGIERLCIAPDTHDDVDDMDWELITKN